LLLSVWNRKHAASNKVWNLVAHNQSNPNQ
jgi:hypothetical protein